MVNTDHLNIERYFPLVPPDVVKAELPLSEKAADTVVAARAALERVGLKVDPDETVETLSQHEAQLVEIARAVNAHPAILVLDEPTSALSRSEVEKLFAIIRQLKSEGLAIVYISHHLPEVYEVADRVTVLRDGRRVETAPIAAISSGRLVELMVGRRVEATRIQRQLDPGAPRLEVHGLGRYGFFHDVSFEIRRGEVLGLAGLAGSGRSEIARSLCGIDPCDEGAAELDGRLIEAVNLREAMRQGLGYLTEDRKLQGLALRLDAQSNSLAALNARSHRQVARGKARMVFQRLAAELQLFPAEPHRRLHQFSGGNQQKVLLAKWMAIEPEVLILDEPTRGVDIGAKQVIHKAIGRLAERGKCILLISSDLPELVCLSNRVVVLRKGHLVRELSGCQITEDQILLAAYAGNKNDDAR